MMDQGISISNIFSHKHWSGKECLHKLFSRWDSLKIGITVADTSGKSTVKPAKATTKYHQHTSLLLKSHMACQYAFYK